MDAKPDRETPPPSDLSEEKKEGERNRERIDSIPPPGTDPLHEGP
jgi:hypothetical protein